MGHQLSITVDHQGTSRGHLDVTSILELADREIRVIGLIEYRRSLDVQQHVAGLELDTLLTKRFLSRSQDQRVEFRGDELAKLGLDLSVHVRPGNRVPLVDVEIGHTRRAATCRLDTGQEISDRSANLGRARDNHLSAEVPDAAGRTPRCGQCLLIGRRNSGLVKHRRRLLVIRVPQNQPHPVPIRIPGNDVKVEIPEQQHLSRNARLVLTSPGLASATAGSELIGEALEPLLAHLLVGRLADLAARLALHHLATNAAHVVLEGREAPFPTSLFDVGFLFLGFLESFLVFENLAFSGLRGQQTQPRMRAEPVPFPRLASRQRHADHLIGQVRGHDIGFPFHREHNVPGRSKVDLLPCTTPRIVAHDGGLAFEFEVDDIETIHRLGKRVEIQSLTKLLGLIPKSHQATDRNKVVAQRCTNSLFGVVDGATSTPKTAATHRVAGLESAATHRAASAAHRAAGLESAATHRAASAAHRATGLESTATHRAASAAHRATGLESTATHRAAGLESTATTTAPSIETTTLLTIFARSHRTARPVDLGTTVLTNNLSGHLLVAGHLRIIFLFVIIGRRRTHDRLTSIRQDILNRQQNRDAVLLLLFVG